jgi:hypothetical protein
LDKEGKNNNKSRAKARKERKRRKKVAQEIHLPPFSRNGTSLCENFERG